MVLAEVVLLALGGAGGAVPTPAREAAGVVVPAGYTRTPQTDCGYPVCATITTDPGRVGGNCGIYGPKPCDLNLIAAACNATAGCEGFNSVSASNGRAALRLALESRLPRNLVPGDAFFPRIHVLQPPGYTMPNPQE